MSSKIFRITLSTGQTYTAEVEDITPPEPTPDPTPEPEPPAPTPRSSKWLWLIELLAGIGVIALTVATYLLGGGMLFG